MLLISCPNLSIRRIDRYFSRRFLNYDFYVVIMLPWFLHIYNLYLTLRNTYTCLCAYKQKFHRHFIKPYLFSIVTNILLKIRDVDLNFKLFMK